MLSTPCSTRISASRSVAQVIPMAPARICFQASMGVLWFLKWGRSLHGRPTKKLAMSRRLASIASRSTSSAGVFIWSSSMGSGQYLFVQLNFETLDETRTHVVEEVRDVGCGAVLVKGVLVFPFFDERDAIRLVGALVEFITNAAGLGVRGLHQNVQGVNQFFSLAVPREEFGDAHHLGSAFIWHIGLFLP